MKTHSTILLGLLLNLACFGQEVNSFSKDNISFDFPSHWVIQDVPNYYILVSEPETESLLPLATFDVQVDSLNTSLDQFCEDYEVMMGSNAAVVSFDVVSKEKIQFLGVDAYDMHCSAVLQNLSIAWRSLVFRKDGVTYKLTTTSMVNTFFSLKEVTNPIFDSFLLE